MLGGRSSLPTTCPNSLDARSFLSKSCSSIRASLGSKTSSALRYYLRYPKICITCSICPFLGNAKCEDIMDTSKQISTHPNSTIHRSIPIKIDSMMRRTTITPQRHLVQGDMLIAWGSQLCWGSSSACYETSQCIPQHFQRRLNILGGTGCPCLHSIVKFHLSYPCSQVHLGWAN